MCSGINTTYNAMPRGDTYHGTATNVVASFSSNNNKPQVYRITGYRGHGTGALNEYLSGLKVDWHSGRDSGSIFCGPTNPSQSLVPINLTPIYGNCVLYSIGGKVDQSDEKLIRSLDFTRTCQY